MPLINVTMISCNSDERAQSQQKFCLVPVAKFDEAQWRVLPVRAHRCHCAFNVTSAFSSSE